MKKERFPVLGTLKFVFIAVVFMLLADQFIFGGKRSYIEEAKTVKIERPEPVRVEPDNGAEYFEAPPEVITEVPDAPVVPVEPAPMAEPDDIVKAPETPVPPPAVMKDDGKYPHPRIAIIIDDLGMDVKRSRQVVDLPAPITLAFLPYGTKTKELAKVGKEKGHTLIIHTPMEAMDGKLNIGPGGLRASMDGAAMSAAFDVMLKSFEGYEGINNHMGSRLTQDKAAMDRIMKVLAAKGLFFVDSKTSAQSVGAREAAQDGVPFAERDVFLDHVDSAEFVKGALARLEKVAKSKGSAIAIGHPKDHTIAALKAWIPTLQAKGIELVSVKDLLRRVPVAQAAPAEPMVAPVADVPVAPVAAPIEMPVQDKDVIENVPVTAPVYGPTLPEIQLHPLPEQSPAPLSDIP